MRAVLLLAALLAVGKPVSAVDEGWFFFSLDGQQGLWERSPRNYPTLSSCELAGKYKAHFAESHRYLVLPCIPADASAPPVPSSSRLILESPQPVINVIR